MAKIKFYLDCRTQLKDGSYPLKLSVSHRGSFRYISLNIHLIYKDWSKEDQQVKSTCRNYRRLNTWLNETHDNVSQLLLDMRSDAAWDTYDVDEYARRIDLLLNGKARKKTGTTFGEQLKKFASSKKESTRKLYEYTLSRMEGYYPGAGELKFSDIKKEWLLGFVDYLKRTSSSMNYINIQLRNIRAVFNYAISEGHTEYYPFAHLKIKAVETRSRALSLEQLRELFNYKVEEYQRQYVDMFKLMFYLCGINAVDLFSLKEIRNGRVEYYRQKTGKFISIKVEPEAQEIIDRYRGKSYLLNIRERYANYKDFVHRMNTGLQKIGKCTWDCNTGEKTLHPAFPGLSTYWARHTWATMADTIDIPINTIGKALGHSTRLVTEIYIKKRLDKIDAANRKVIDFVLGKQRADQGLIPDSPELALDQLRPTRFGEGISEPFAQISMSTDIINSPWRMN